jgi:cytoskeletal protein CcmA (bactofilin family)
MPKINQKLTSGALQFTVFIAILIALLLGGLVLYAQTFLYFKEQSKATIDNIHFSNTGINYLLKQNELNTDTIALNFSEKNNQSIQGHISQWGIFIKAYVKSQHRKKVFIKSALAGGSMDTETTPTLFLQETYNPVSVVGNTKIKGVAYLPSQGIKTGYIGGQSYYGSQLVYGKIEKSELKLPNLEKKYLEQLKLYSENSKPINNDEFVNINSRKKILNSFEKKTIYIYSNRLLNIDDVAISGNVIIKSDTLIRVKKTAQLKDVIIIAPIVEIEDETSGCFQVMARKKILVGKKCSLSYPSALVLLQDNRNINNQSNQKYDNQIFIDKESNIKGCVCYFQTKEILSDFNTQIVLEEKSSIKGQVYCEGSFELKGTVSGSVFTRQFIANQLGSIFVNHIYNGVIENDNIPKIYSGLIYENHTKVVMKWLY